MKGVSKEGLVGWDADRGESGTYGYPEHYRNVVLAYRMLKADPLTAHLAVAVRDAGNAWMRLSVELEEAVRKGREGKTAQKWEDFIRPFAAMDASQLAEWIITFKEGVAEAKDRIKREGVRIANQ